MSLPPLTNVRQPPPQSKKEFSELMFRAAQLNETLLRYTYPIEGNVTNDATRNWVPTTAGCEVCQKCYCFHVAGDMKISVNPTGWKECAHEGRVSRCRKDYNKECNCFRAKVGGTCLFSDMRPTKVLAAITAARLAGVTHIIEEGRFGGLTAMMYALHGFEVTSIEFLPLKSVTRGLKQWAPSVRLIDGDGKKLVPELVSNLTAEEGQRTMVIFDGEKRTEAWATFRKFPSRVALAIFDDSNIGNDWKPFVHGLDANGWTWWDTRDTLWPELIAREEAALKPLRPLKQITGKWHGGVHDLQHFHFAIVKGGSWLT